MAEVLLALSLLLGAAQPAPPLVPPAAVSRVAALDWLAGSWRGPGATMGNADEAQLDVRPALGGRFLEFSYRAGRFEGRAFYRTDDGLVWSATWFDSRGVSFGIHAAAEGRMLTSDWGSAETERGRTTYRLADDGRLHVTDEVRRPDGSYREFAAHILTRAE